MRIIKIIITIICIVLVTFIGTYIFFSYAFYSPQQIAHHKELTRITDVDFPELRMHDWVLAENGVDNCWYWIQASFEELPDKEFYKSIENLIYKGNEHWKIESDNYIFQKEKITVRIKKHKPGIYIDMYEFLFVWE
jgi:hypothetical protein